MDGKVEKTFFWSNAFDGFEGYGNVHENPSKNVLPVQASQTIFVSLKDG